MYVWESLGFIISITLITVGFFYKIKKKRKKSKRQIILIALGLFFVLLIINSNNNNVNSLNNESDIKVKLSTLHQPIHINNNWSDAKAAGICTGSGIYSDPYIIEDYIIDNGGAGTCIDIENSELYFIIQNCTLYNSGSYPDAGIKLVNITNGVLINNNCSFNNGSGIYLSSSHNNSILSNNGNDNIHGILLEYNSNNNTISGNTVNNNIAKGIMLLNSHNNTISGNTANKNDIGIRVDIGNSNKILGNNVNNNSGYSGIYITDSNNTIVSRNNASYSGWYGISIRNSCYYNVIIGNNVSNSRKSGMLLQNSYNNSISANILKYNGDHGLYLTNSHNNNIKDMIVDGGDSGSCILIENTDKYFRIENCTVYNSAGGDNDAGIKLNYADNGLLINNNCSFNKGDGIRLENSNNNIIMENIANNNNQYGIKLRYCDYNTISENEANYNGLSGIHLHWSNNNNVSGNVANYNPYGIWLAGNCPAVPCDYNTISKNAISNNNYGIVLAGSDYNTVWENLFIDNKKEIQGYDNCLNNNWDNGTVGNYWDDYKDRYPSATNNGFIWDTPYEINGTTSSQDNYPLFLPTVYFLFINFEISDQYLNTTMPLETDLGLKISCYVINSTTLSWVYLCENSTGVIVNHSMNEDINGFWSHNLDISGLDRGDKLMISFYANDSNGNIGQNDNNGLNFSILIGDYYVPIITFEISDTYLSTTRPLETDLSLEINCSISDLSTIEWVYLSENSTGVFINRSMNEGINELWSYNLDISSLVEGDQLMFSFYANDSYNNIGSLDNSGLNFSIFIGDYYREPIYIDGNNDFTSQNGVRNPWASGTNEDPYIIENWIIDAGGSGSAILIENSNVFFRIENCTVYNSGSSSLYAGIKLYNAKNGTIINNYCFNNSQGIRVGFMNGNNTIGNIIIMGNDCSNNSNTGIVLVKYSNNTIFKNNCSYNGIKGIQLAGGVNNTVSENKCFSNEWGIFLSDYIGVSSNNNTISGNNIFNNTQDGIQSTNCNDNIISGNNITNNGNYGIYLLNSNNSIISQNNVSYSGIYGIFLKYSYNNSIRKNDAFYNTHNGLAFDGACNNLIYENNFSYNTYVGINMYYQSHNNTIFNNTFRENGWQGVYINDPIPNNNNYNKIYMNKFIGNNNSIVQACDNGYNNQWDNGTMGNYWSDYEDKYPNARNDGLFWDMPYAISGPAASYDNHPLDNFLEEDPQYFDIKATPTVYSVNGIYEFNCTWLDDDNALSEVYLKFNGTYYLVTENYSGEFSYTFYDLSANESGYSYQWLAKDHYNAWIATPIYYFVLQKANAPLSLLFNGTGGDCTKYAHQYVNISLINENEVPGEIFLYINGNLIEQSSSFSITNISRYSVIGIYNVTGILIHQNYTGRITYWMTIDDIIAPDITFEISPFYLNTTTPQYYQTGLQINCTVQDDTSIIWVYLCENSTGIFVNRSMSYVNGNYTINLDISSLNWGNTIMFSFYAKDSAGNIKWKNNGGLNYSIQIYDFQDPITVLDFDLSFNPNFVNISTLFSLLAEDNMSIGGSGVKTISYKIDSDGWNIYSVPFNLSGYSEGIHIIYYYTADYAGNIEITKQITVYIDINNVASSIDFIYYEDSGIKYVNNFTQFIINWNDGTGSGLQNIFYKIDSENFSVYSASFTLLGYSEGLHNITYYTIDNVGNLELEKSITIYLDITALDLNIFYNVIYSSNYIDENTSISITSIEDLGSGVKNVQYRIDEGIWINGTEFNLNGLTLGEHTIYYRVEDNIGNFRQKSEVVFLVTNESDIDDDGLTYQEEQNFSTDPFNDDTDGDKLLDGDEVNIYHTNPLSRDTDGDGYSDYDEIFVYGTDPNNALSSPTMNVIIIIIVLSAITISGYIGVKKWKVIHRRRAENKVITRISEDKVKILDHNTLNERLQKVKSKLNFEDILKKSNVNGQYILNGALFVKNIGIEKFTTLIEKMVKKIYDQNLSKREDVNLIKLNIKDLEQDEKLMEFIKKLKGERV